MIVHAQTLLSTVITGTRGFPFTIAQAFIICKRFVVDTAICHLLNPRQAHWKSAVAGALPWLQEGFMGMKHDYKPGDAIRLVSPHTGWPCGEQAEIVHVIRNAEGDIESLNILFSDQGGWAWGTTVYPHEVEPMPSPVTLCA
jgi:hypothetical protein